MKKWVGLYFLTYNVINARLLMEEKVIELIENNILMRYSSRLSEQAKWLAELIGRTDCRYEPEGCIY